MSKAGQQKFESILGDRSQVRHERRYARPTDLVGHGCVLFTPAHAIETLLNGIHSPNRKFGVSIHRMQFCNAHMLSIAQPLHQQHLCIFSPPTPSLLTIFLPLFDLSHPRILSSYFTPLTPASSTHHILVKIMLPAESPHPPP